MEFKVLEETNDKIVFELPGETHTFGNFLKEELRLIKGVTLAAYKVEHPLLGIPRFQVETKSIEPRKALKEALKSMKKQAADFNKELGKL